MTMNQDHLFHEMERTVQKHGLGRVVATPQPLRGDGSDRRFFRLALKPERSIIVVLPPPQAGPFSKEAASAASITSHLAAGGVAVPQLLGYEPGSGMLLYEDAGDVHLSEIVSQLQDNEERIESIYRSVIDALLRMQIAGAEGFTADLCWDAPRYDRQTMIEREALYFLNSFCVDYHGMEIDKDSLLSEILQIIERIEEISGRQGNFFLHRDFQSRNIMMLADGTFRIIDYQAGRLGPLAYDLASLLIDPYAALAVSLQQRLLGYYCQQLQDRYALDPLLLEESYDFLACMRNMQILGAYSFLSRQRGKSFFEQFIPAALKNLNFLIQRPWGANLPALQHLVRTLSLQYGFSN